MAVRPAAPVLPGAGDRGLSISRTDTLLVRVGTIMRLASNVSGPGVVLRLASTGPDSPGGGPRAAGGGLLPRELSTSAGNARQSPPPVRREVECRRAPTAQKSSQRAPVPGRRAPPGRPRRGAADPISRWPGGRALTPAPPASYTPNPRVLKELAELVPPCTIGDSRPGPESNTRR